MVEASIKFHNILSRCNNCPERWLKDEDDVIEKGKGLKLGKLRVTQLIEAESQLFLRIFLGFRIE